MGGLTLDCIRTITIIIMTTARVSHTTFAVTEQHFRCAFCNLLVFFPFIIIIIAIMFSEFKQVLIINLSFVYILVCWFAYDLIIYASSGGSCEFKKNIKNIDYFESF